MKNNNYKYFIGLIIGLLLVTSVYGASEILPSDIIYDSSNSSHSSGDVQGAIDDLAEKIDEIRPTSCPDKTYCIPYKFELAEGDYVSYTPEIKSYPIDKSITGYTGKTAQTLYPSELNLWRVLNINSDGTVDLISEYVSSTKVYFEGKNGYLNYVGYLNTLADQYKIEEITEDARYFGYNGQTEFIDPSHSTFLFSKTPPFKCMTGGTCSPDPDDNEYRGGGDTLYTTDYDKLLSVVGDITTFMVGTETKTDYFVASRTYYYGAPNSYTKIFEYRIRFVRDNYATLNTSFALYEYQSTSASPYISSQSAALRPIVTLKAGLQYEGVGIESSPMRIK